MYNLSSILNGTTPHEMIVGVNDNSGGILGVTIIVALFLVLFVAYSRREFHDNLIATSFITSLVAATMWGFDLLPTAYAIPTAVIFLIAILFKFMTKQG